MKKMMLCTILLVVLVLSMSLPLMAQDDTGRKVIKDAILGAGTGAIAAGASGGKAGKGALIGAGTGAIGGVLMDVITEPSSSKSKDAASTEENYSAQELYRTGYENGYKEGFKAGFEEGLKQGAKSE